MVDFGVLEVEDALPMFIRGNVRRVDVAAGQSEAQLALRHNGMLEESAHQPTPR